MGLVDFSFLISIENVFIDLQVDESIHSTELKSDYHLAFLNRITTIPALSIHKTDGGPCRRIV
ncbi:hypothetical protein XBI1_650009 [Xenorhabdus bovienii str. Intermedium]|uniref:Uncharacterized protein n=1 Tax=Xenorhabdus bovienii str. Intermedium TaxID=1379677 RepID=A0A077QFP8_XENBV|nr:hypothetical protein XBI1_650009 [Xenorhabdus bovienii str. Intermedium]